MNKYLNEGYRSISYLTLDNYIILKGKNEEAYLSYQHDIKVLKEIKKYITCVKIPQDITLIEKSKDYPYGGLKYKLIKGKVFNYNDQEIYNMNAIASKLGGFLNELHGIRVNYNKEEVINHEKNRVERNIKLLFNYLSYQDKENVKKWQEEYYQELDCYTDYCLVHGDLWYENYIITEDGQDLKGIIDFENTSIFMKEYDFVPFLYISKEFLEQVIKSYHGNINRKLIDLLFVRREICSFLYILEYEPSDTLELVDKIRDRLDNYNKKANLL